MYYHFIQVDSVKYQGYILSNKGFRYLIFMREPNSLLEVNVDSQLKDLGGSKTLWSEKNKKKRKEK